MTEQAWMGIYGFGVLLALVGFGVPVGLAMGLVGFGGLWLILGLTPAFNTLGIMASSNLASASLVVVPLFVMMGLLAGYAGMSTQLFRAANAFIGHIRGGLTMATIATCAGFGAICGSSLATAATMSKVALPEMRRHGYDDSLATGTIAVGSTLGILIPPSIMLILYAIITETPLGDLFIAALVPGLMAIIFYILTIFIVTFLNPSAAPAGPRSNWRTRLQGLRDIGGVTFLFMIVIGGIYGGVFTPTEAAAVGAFGTFLFFIARCGLDWNGLRGVLLETAGTTAMIFLIVIGASLFSFFMSISGLPRVFASAVIDLGLSPLMILFTIMALYIVLGCFIDSIGMMTLTVPILLPLVVSIAPDLGMTPRDAAIWFGIFVIIAIEIGLVTPPFGLNVFIIKGTAPGLTLTTIYLGVIPFWLADVIRLVLLILFPVLTLYLPSLR